MGTFSKSLLLFAMNWLDAQLTILWVRLHIASEANLMMARVLSRGEAPFLSLKLAIGTFAAYVLYRSAHLPVAKRGMEVVLGIYAALMFMHIITGFWALGWHAPGTVLAYFVSLPRCLMAFFF